MRQYLLLFLLLFGMSSDLYAADVAGLKAKGDSAYADRLYTDAVALYTEVLAEAPSSVVYYNLGNAQFRLKQYAPAVLAYERALWLDPSNEDARFNLELLRTRLPDRFAQPQRMFFVAWTSDAIAACSASDWSLWSLLAVLLAGLCWGLYRAALPLVWRKLGFFFALLFVGSALFTLLAAGLQASAYAHNARAVVMKNSVPCYVSPTTTSKRAVILNEGVTVEILATSGNTWLQAALPDGREVWLAKKNVVSVVPEKK